MKEIYNFLRKIQKGFAGVSQHDLNPKHQYDCGVKPTFYGETSENFQKKVLSVWNSIPASYKFLILYQNIEVCSGRTALDVFPDQANVVWKANEDVGDQRTRMDQLGGAYYRPEWPYSKENAKAFVTEFYLEAFANSNIVPANKYQLPTSDGLVKNQFVSEGMRHELFHALDDSIFPQPTMYKEFIDSYKTDIKRMGGREQVRQHGYQYFTSSNPGQFTNMLAPWRRDVTELFAELGAEILGGSQTGDRVKKDWPNTFKLVSRMHNNITTCFDVSLGSLMRLFDFDANIFQNAIPLKTTGKVSPNCSDNWFRILRREVCFGEKQFLEWAEATKPKARDLLLVLVGPRIREIYPDHATYPNDNRIYELFSKTIKQNKILG